MFSFGFFLIFPFGMCILPSDADNSKAIKEHIFDKYKGEKSRTFLRFIRLIMYIYRGNIGTMEEGLAYFPASIICTVSAPQSGCVG